MIVHIVEKRNIYYRGHVDFTPEQLKAIGKKFVGEWDYDLTALEIAIEDNIEEILEFLDTRPDMRVIDEEADIIFVESIDGK